LGADEASVIVPEHIPDDVREVCVRLRAAGHQAHLVGGGVRDLLLGRVPADFDVATDAHPERVMQLFGARFAIPTGLQHGTVTVLTEPQSAPGDQPARRHVEVTTFRGEGAYLDGRRPSSVTYVSSLEEDLGRRDFTMNAVAYDPVSGVLTDPHGGREDLRRLLIRAVGDPVQRFREDGLRPMRAVRLATQLELDIDPPTLAAIPVTLGVFRRVSAERIRDELLKLLGAPRPSRGIELLRGTGLLGEVLPELLESLGVEQNRFHKHDVYVHTLATVDATPGDAITRLGALLHDIGKPRARQPGAAAGEHTFYGHEEIGARVADAVARRLKLANADRERVVALVAHHMFFYTPDWSDGTVRRFVRRVGSELLPSLFALRHGDVVARGFGEDPRVELAPLEGRIAQVAAADAVLRVADLAIGGRDVMRILGIGPGPRVGRLLEALLERVVDDASLNEPARLEALLRELEATISA
jgi:tRNA nucleotidyltransferase (CCA-adding enzyme)